MRANGIESWLTEENRKDFLEYEKTVDEKLSNKRMIVLCSYPLSSSSAAQVVDVVNAHQLAVIRRGGNWKLLETPELKQAKQEIKRLNEELELEQISIFDSVMRTSSTLATIPSSKVGSQAGVGVDTVALFVQGIGKVSNVGRFQTTKICRSHLQFSVLFVFVSQHCFCSINRRQFSLARRH